MPNPAIDRLFMWAGGKNKLITQYTPLFPQDVHERQIHEPFAGGAALFNHLASQRQISGSLSDVNDEIIGLYRMVRDNPTDLIIEMSRLQDAWIPLDKEGRKAFYYEKRSEYWQLPHSEKATALLYFLMKTGFNGIWQTCKASKGRYGTPVGLANQKTAVFCPDTVMAWHAKLSNVDLTHCGFDQVSVKKDAFVFCDPPYRDSFTTYGTAFDDDAQLNLISWCREVHKNTGSIVWLSNRDAGDGFFENNAPDAVMHKFPVTYTAGRRKKTESGFKAKPATEVLLTWG